MRILKRTPPRNQIENKKSYYLTLSTASIRGEIVGKCGHVWDSQLEIRVILLSYDEEMFGIPNWRKFQIESRRPKLVQQKLTCFLESPFLGFN